jgi:hypothetical protein
MPFAFSPESVFAFAGILTGDPVRTVPVEGTRVGPGALPLSDGPLLRYLAVGEEFVNISRLGLPAVKLWAYYHLCLFGWPIPLPTTDDRSLMY